MSTANPTLRTSLRAKRLLRPLLTTPRTSLGAAGLLRPLLTNGVNGPPRATSKPSVPGGERVRLPITATTCADTWPVVVLLNKGTQTDE